MVWDRVALDWPRVENGLATSSDWAIVEQRVLAAAPRASKAGSVALDIGCGVRHQRFRSGLLSLGYEPIGIDTSGEAPDALADAHLLPMPSASIDLLLTSAVFEHLKNPYLAMTEAARVAKDGAHFLGSIAFGEPFHISYFHHSPLAVFELLDSTGFEVDAIILSDRYNVFFAHLEMGYVGVRIPRVLHRPFAQAVRAIALAPAAIKAIVQRETNVIGAARLAFARSHTAAVGFISRRRSRT